MSNFVTVFEVSESISCETQHNSESMILENVEKLSGMEVRTSVFVEVGREGKTLFWSKS